MILTIQKRGTITISRDARGKLGIEPGDPLLETVENGCLILTPVAVVPRTLKLTPKGEKKIEEAEELGKLAKEFILIHKIPEI